MSKEDCIELEGEVIDVLPNAMFTVRLQNGKEILSHLSGKLRMNYIKILQGDCVKVEISPYDLTRGRITWRMKGSSKPTVQAAESTVAPDASDVSNIQMYSSNIKNVNVENAKSDSVDTSNLIRNR